MRPNVKTLGLAQRLAGTSVAVAFALAGCSGSATPAASTNRSTTTAKRASSPTDRATAQRQRDERDVSALVKTFYDELARVSSTSRDPNDPQLAAVLVDPALGFYRGRLEQEKTDGEIWRIASTTTMVTTIERVTIDGDAATVVSCQANDIVVVKADTGEVVNGEPLAYRSTWKAVRTQKVWRLSDSMRNGTFAGVLACPAA